MALLPFTMSVAASFSAAVAALLLMSNSVVFFFAIFVSGEKEN